MSNPLDMFEATCTGLVRRMVSLPRAISRAVDQGLDRMRAEGGRTNHHQFRPPHIHPRPYHNTTLDQSMSSDNFQPADLGFLAGFENQYGLTHPFFYACRFIEVLKMAENEHKFVFLYLHSHGHPFTPTFCKETLCSELMVEFLDANFVTWGGFADRGEGLHLARTVRPSTFPFCAIVAPCSGENFVVVQQLEGPVTPDELVETLQTTLEEQGSTFGNGREKEQKKRADIRLRQEQDAAYSASLKADQEKVLKQIKKSQHQDNAIGNAQEIQILIRFPNGERKEKSFSQTDKIESIFKFIDSMGLPGVSNNYKLVSSFPRKVFDVDQMKMTLKDAGFYPKATLYIEFV